MLGWAALLTWTAHAHVLVSLWQAIPILQSSYSSTLRCLFSCDSMQKRLCSAKRLTEERLFLSRFKGVWFSSPLIHCQAAFSLLAFSLIASAYTAPIKTLCARCSSVGPLCIYHSVLFLFLVLFHLSLFPFLFHFLFFLLFKKFTKTKNVMFVSKLGHMSEKTISSAISRTHFTGRSAVSCNCFTYFHFNSFMWLYVCIQRVYSSPGPTHIEPRTCAPLVAVCPTSCTCNNNIVDCRRKSLTEIPANLPEGIIEM